MRAVVFPIVHPMLLWASRVTDHPSGNDTAHALLNLTNQIEERISLNSDSAGERGLEKALSWRERRQNVVREEYLLFREILR